jgi:hypothetical protein
MDALGNDDVLTVIVELLEDIHDYSAGAEEEAHVIETTVRKILQRLDGAAPPSIVLP